MPLVCLNHPDRVATVSCAYCSKPLCSDCVYRRGRNVYCSEECLRSARPSVSGGDGRGPSAFALHPTPLRLAVSALILAVTAVVVLLLAGF
jgi:hypothetical protein